MIGNTLYMSVIKCADGVFLEYWLSGNDTGSRRTALSNTDVLDAGFVRTIRRFRVDSAPDKTGTGVSNCDNIFGCVIYYCVCIKKGINLFLHDGTFISVIAEVLVAK